MAARRDGGANQQVISLEEITENAVVELKEIEAEDSTQSVKTKKFKRLADKIKNQLHDDRRKAKSIAITTFKRYISIVRNAIKDTGLTHHSLHATTARTGTLARVIRDFPEYEELLLPLRKEPARTIGALKNTILKTIRADKENKRRGAAYKAVKAMNTDHEVLRHLFMDDVDMADWNEQKADALNSKKGNTVDLVNADIQKIIREGLASDSYTRQAFALALASGRRAIEILFNAEFVQSAKNTVLFDGQAKKQTGIETDAYEIYTLIPASEFSQAFEAFRKHEKIVELHKDYGHLDRDERNTEINRRTAKTMNEAAKRAMGDKARVFKDSRAIYTRICLDTFYKSDEQCADKDEDVFVKHLLGHGDFTAQAAYKQFKIDYEAPESVNNRSPKKGGDSHPENATDSTPAPEPKAKELQAATKAVDAFVTANPSRHQIADYHNKVIEWANANPHRKITFSALYKKNKGGIGGHRDTIRDYLDVISQQVEKYNQTR